MSYTYTTYQYPQYTPITTQQPRTIAIDPPTSAGLNRRATVRTSAPVNVPQYSYGVPISSGVTRSTTQVRPQRTQFAPLPPLPPLRDVPVVTRSGSRSRRSNSLNAPRQPNLVYDDYDPYPTRSSTVSYGSRTIGSQAPYDSYDYPSSYSRSRRATSAPARHPLQPVKELEDFNVGSSIPQGRLFDEPHLPFAYADYSAGGRDTRRKGQKAETYGDRYGPSSSRGGSAGGHKGGGGMFGWLVGHK